MYPSASDVRLIIDQSLADDQEMLNFHPFHSELASKIYFSDLLLFLSHFNKFPEFLKLESTPQ